MARPQPTSSARVRTSGARAVCVVAASAVLVASLVCALAVVVAASTRISPSFPAVAVLGALLGAMAAPPVRLPLERRDAAGRGAVIVLTGMVISGALVAAMGLAVLAAATSAGCVAHAVQVRPTTRQLARTSTMAVAMTAAAWAAQSVGLVDGLISPAHSAVLMVGLWVLLVPGMLNAADMSRRAAAAAEQLDAERLAHVAALQHTVSHDAVTGLLSRRGLTTPLAHAAAVARPGHLSAVLFIDLDGFKTVNDVHGHDAGDALLGELGRRLGSALPAGGQAARIGGDEFVVLVTNVADGSAAHALAGEVQALLEAPVLLPDGARVGVGASTGVACWSVPGSAAEFLAEADAAMYEAKRARRRRREGVGSR